MINKKLGLIVAAGFLSLAACGAEEPTSTSDVIVEDTTNQESETTSTEETSEEETSTETVQEAEEEPMEESSTEAASGAASDLLSKGDSTSFVFNETGEFSIFCEPHPVMKMTIIVEEGAEQSGEVGLDIADYEFSEETITVAPGTNIVWTNQDLAQHNVAIE